MTERPILFSGPMVRAILSGSKTVTRRTVKLPRWAVAGTEEVSGGVMEVDTTNGCTADVPCPYGAPGDRLWVRETFALLRNPGALETWVLHTPETAPTPTNTFLGCIPTPIYGADGERPDVLTPRKQPMTWRPSIFMPQWASRITLEIVSVRVERLHAITEEDAIREGVDAVSVADVPRNGTLSRRDDFVQLWQKINGKRAPWGSNPFVWRIEFRRVEVHRG